MPTPLLSAAGAALGGVAPDADEALTFEALRRFEGDQRAYEYRERMARKRDVIDDHERRLLPLEVGQAAVQAQLREISAEAHAT